MSVKFILPPEHKLKMGNADDPVWRLYQPIWGKLFIARFNLLLSLLPENRRFRRILEIGYGSGILIPTLKNVGEQIVGVDYESEPAIAEENLRLIGAMSPNITLLKDDIFNFPSSEQFDLIVGVSVFQQISDCEKILERIREMLPENGYFLVGMPRVDPIMTHLLKITGGTSNVGTLHVTNYASFLECSKKHFQVVAEKRLFPFLPGPCALYHGVLLKPKQ